MKTTLLIIISLLSISVVRSQTTLASQDFDGTNTWSYSPIVGGDGVFSTSNSIGVSGSNGLGYYYNSCKTGSTGSTSSVTFSTVNVAGYSSVKIRFRMAWGGTAWGNSCGSGTGIDTDDYIEIQASRNGGAFGRVCYYNGYSNRTFVHNSTSVSLAYNANESHRADAWSNIGTWEITFPAGTTSVGLKIILKCNRDHENFFLDNFIVEGVNSLPVELLGLDAVRNDSGAKIEWKTLSESNSSHFLVQRSEDQGNFTTVGYVAAAGNSNVKMEYQYIDYSVPSSEVCYRLLQYDYDGTEYDKGIKCLSDKQEEDNTLVYYNSNSGCIVVSGYINSCSQIELADITGRVLMRLPTNADSETLLSTEGLSGVYLVQVVSNGLSKTFKIVV